MTGRIVRPYGSHALLVEFTDPAELAGVAAALSARPPAGVIDVVPAARTVLLDAEPGVDLAALAAHVRSVAPEPAATDVGDDVEITVRYDGPDLAAVAEHTGLRPAGVVAAHTAQTWTVAFCGFAPGFGYLTGADRRLHVPRRSEPRTRVPTGAVGLAGEYSGVYPSASPGGWQLIGTTDAVLWDVDRDPPALLRPGTRVRFRAAG